MCSRSEPLWLCLIFLHFRISSHSPNCSLLPSFRSSDTRWYMCVSADCQRTGGACSLWSFLLSTWALPWYPPHVLNCAVSAVPGHVSGLRHTFILCCLATRRDISPDVFSMVLWRSETFCAPIIPSVYLRESICVCVSMCVCVCAWRVCVKTHYS